MMARESFLKERFQAESRYSEEMGIHFVKINMDDGGLQPTPHLITALSKEELLKEYEKVQMSRIKAWRVVGDMADIQIAPVMDNTEALENDLPSFGQVRKKALDQIHFVLGQVTICAKELRSKARKLRALKKAQALSEWLDEVDPIGKKEKPC
jgi:hypothetical protein